MSGQPSNKREIFGWQMYDWAVSAFSTTVTTALLGPYLFELAEENGGVELAGFTIDPGSFFPFAVSLSALLQVVVLPLVGAIADHTDHKRRMMMLLSYFGSALLTGLFLVTVDTVLLGGALFVVAGVAFASALVIYNSYLPEIAPPGLRDRVSSVGFAYGYVGGGLWLAFNFILIALMDNTGLAVRISLGATGLWCLFFFALFPGRMIQNRPAARAKPEDRGWLRFSFASAVATLGDLRRHYPVAFRFLLAYLLFIDGVGTVITVSTSFAADELNAEPETLLALVLMIQFVGVGGALGFGRLAGRIGAKRALTANLSVWMAIVVYAFLALDSIAELWILGVGIALVLGGAQALSRSLFSQLIPNSRQAELFGFYEIASRGTSWLGPMAFAIVNQVTESQRLAILSLILFFAGGLAALGPIDIRRGMVDAGQNPDSVVL